MYQKSLIGADKFLTSSIKEIVNNIITEAKKINHCLSNKAFDIKTPRTETHRRGINIIPAPFGIKKL